MMFIMSMRANQMAWINSDLKNTILIDIIKMTLFYIVSRNIYYYHLSPNIFFDAGTQPL